MAETDWLRVVTLTEGVAMVITDLHGDWDAYCLCRDAFIRAHQAGDAQYLIFTGDLIHRESLPHEDRSLQIVLDVLELRQAYPESVIYMCGNHELPHIYGVTLAKGNFIYTPRFEAELGSHRSEVVRAFRSLPFYVRTQAGVAITHAGAAAPLSEPRNCERLFQFRYEAVFNRVEAILQGKNLEQLRSGIAKLSGESYDVQAKKYLAITGPDDPRYNDLLRGFYASSDPTFELVWAALFTRCEKEYGQADYTIFLRALLQSLSTDFYPQNWLVAGHINVQGGYGVIAKSHLRIASGKHALPLKKACYLQFDVSRPVAKMKDLLAALRPVYL